MKVNIDNFKVKVEKIKQTLKEAYKQTVYAVSLKGAETASRYTPPAAGKDENGHQIWKRGIANGMYKRVILDALPLIQGKAEKALKFTTSFGWNRQRLRKEFEANKKKNRKSGLFLAFHLGQSKTKQVWIGKSERELAPYHRIKYRGLMKASWGLQFLKLGYASTTFSNLLKKSPGLMEKAGNNVLTLTETGDTITLHNMNRTM